MGLSFEDKYLLYVPSQAHDEVCPEFPLTCEGCGKKIPREKVSVRPCAAGVFGIPVG